MLFITFNLGGGQKVLHFITFFSWSKSDSKQLRGGPRIMYLCEHTTLINNNSESFYAMASMVDALYCKMYNRQPHVI